MSERVRGNKLDQFKTGFSTGQNSMHMNLPPATRTRSASLSTCRRNDKMGSAHKTTLYGIMRYIYCRTGTFFGHS